MNTTNKTRHTAGNWFVALDEHNPQTKVFNDQGWQIAECFGADNTEAEANARLIASAPIMLEALERIVEARKNGCLDITEWALVDQAIKQAKGE